RQDYCQPKDFCEFKSGKCQSSLQQADPLFAESQLICEGAGPLSNGVAGTKITAKDIDCPLFQFNVEDKRKLPGCIGVKITLGDNTQFQADDQNQQPRPCCFPNNPNDPKLWNTPFTRATAKAGMCINTPIGEPPQFCDQVMACD